LLIAELSPKGVMVRIAYLNPKARIVYLLPAKARMVFRA